MDIRRSIPLFFILGALFVVLTMALGPFGSSETTDPSDDETN